MQVLTVLIFCAGIGGAAGLLMNIMGLVALNMFLALALAWGFHNQLTAVGQVGLIFACLTTIELAYCASLVGLRKPNISRK
jgi:hypothetical protein